MDRVRLSDCMYPLTISCLLVLGTQAASADFQILRVDGTATAEVDLYDADPSVFQTVVGDTVPYDMSLFIEDKSSVSPSASSFQASAGAGALLDEGRINLSFASELYYFAHSDAVRVGGAGHLDMESTVEFSMPADQVRWTYSISVPVAMYTTWTLGATLTDLTNSRVLYRWSDVANAASQVFTSAKGNVIQLHMEVSADQVVPPGVSPAWWRIDAPMTFEVVDCNDNGVFDPTDIADGTSTDFDTNGLPDDCDSPVIYVNHDAATGGDGASWTTAFKSLDDALDVAMAREAAVIPIWIAEGTYAPARRVVEDDSRSATFLLPHQVYLHGGFSGVESSLPSRNMALHPTILSGDLAGDDGPDFTNRHDNAYHVLMTADFYPNYGFFFLDGLVIRGGYSDASSYNYGAGFLAYGDVVLQNCTFEDNWAGVVAAEGTVAHSNGGGAVTVFGEYESSTEPHFSWRNCRFINNSSSGTGGAVFLGRTNVDFYDCLFEGNIGASGGAVGFEPVGAVSFHKSKFIANDSKHGPGAIWSAYHISSIEIIDCEFKENSGAIGGALLFEGGSDRFVLSGCVFEFNASEQQGGALYLDGIPSEISDCRFYQNQAGERGGALYMRGGAVSVTRCYFEGNDAEQGGAVYTTQQMLELRNSTVRWNNASFGAGLAASDSTVEANHCIFQGNRAIVGGGISVSSQPPTLRLFDSLFLENWAELYGGAIAGGAGEVLVVRSSLLDNVSSGLGAAIMAGPATNIRDCIVWGNRVDLISSVSTDEHAQIEGLPLMDHSIVQGWTGFFGGQGNSGMDPLFVSSLGPDGYARTGDEDYRLSPFSPAANAGNPDFMAPNGATDMDGHARVLCGRVDMGAYESGIGDFDCDGVVDLIDIAGWVACAEGWGEGGECAAMDFDNDGDFDMRDFAGMQRTISE